MADTGKAVVERILIARAAAPAELPEPLDGGELAAMAAAAGTVLGGATTDRPALERLCRLCERAVCERCPVAGALRRVDAGSRGDFGL